MDSRVPQREMPKPQLVQRPFRRLVRQGTVAACYEAGVSGYDLYRQITACGVTCQVIAPALTPRRPGQRIETDRRDAVKLVRLFRAGELTAIHVPDEAEEAQRSRSAAGVRASRAHGPLRRGVRARHVSADEGSILLQAVDLNAEAPRQVRNR